MCYPKPGPRCSKHAAERLKKALDAVSEYQGDDEGRKKSLRQRAVDAQKEYYTSPKGIAALEQKANESGNAKDVAVAKAAKERRRKMLDAYNASKQSVAVSPDPVLPDVAITPLNEPMISSNMHMYEVEYEYDFYGCTGYTCGSEGDDGYCRDAEFENLRISNEPISTRNVLGSIFRASPGDIPDDLVAFAENELELDKPESYEVSSSRGYYGDEAEVTLTFESNVRKKLTEYYLNRPDAKDTAGILPYLRGKGQDTTGLTPVEAVKKHLRAENRGAIVKYVEDANTVYKMRVPLTDVKVPQKKHLETVEPRKPIHPKNVEKFCGVVVKKGNAYFLVDGYHRLKYELGTNNKTGNFLVLEHKS